MDNDKDKGLDDLFKRKLGEPDDPAGFREEDWSAVEQLLNKGKKRGGVVYLLPLLGSVAALLLIFLGWWFLRAPGKNDHTSPAVAINMPHKANAGQKETGQVSPALQDVKNIQAATGRAEESKLNRELAQKTQGGLSGADTANKPDIAKNINKGGELISALRTPPLVYSGTVAVSDLPLPGQSPLPATGKSAQLPGKISVKKQAPFHTQLALSVMAAPDVNSVGGFQQGKLGTNAGLLLSVQPFRKLSFSTGAIYSVKPYLTSFANYQGSNAAGPTPQSVQADCRMFDIPVNINYQVFQRRENKIEIGAGLSSYIMLHQSYTFNYANAYSDETWNYNVPGVSKYYFGVFNINASYERRINSKVAFSIQPYMKVPLTNLGYSQVKLQSTGVALGLNWNLSTPLKP